MGAYHDIVHKLPEEREVMEKLTDMTDEFVESVRLTHPQKYNNFIDKVKKLQSHNHFSKESLEEAYKHENIEQLHSVEDTTNYAKKEFEIDFSKENFNQYDFNFIMNETSRIYSSIYNKDMNKLAELTLAWLDYNHGKAYHYYKKLYMSE